jgi:glyoxylase-like metal-dependent hydrolase (beta-lactamase superfamily II)
MRKLHCVVALFVLIAMGGPALAEEFNHQQIQPAPLLVTWDGSEDEFFEPSFIRKLPMGHRVAVPDFGEPGKWYIQRLTERTYWMIRNAFASTVYVGDESVLVVDVSSSVDPAGMLAALRSFTELPVSTVVYSHPHTDHNAGAVRLQQLLAKQGRELRIVASASAAREISIHQNNVAPPTEVIPDGRSSFKFEDVDFILGTPVTSAHSAADSYVLNPDGVITYVDFNYPGRVPLGYISSSHNITGWVNFLRHVLGEDWNYAVLGHANIGYKRDILQTFAYLEDLYEACNTLILPNWATGESIGEAVQKNGPGLTAGVFWGNYVEQSAETMARAVYPRWKHVAQSEVVRSHAYKVFEDAFLNYNPEVGSVKPLFDAIAP